MIPPPPKLQPFRDEDDVERRLQSLLDVAEEDQPGMESKPKDLSSMKELDRIGYVVCCLLRRRRHGFLVHFVNKKIIYHEARCQS